MRIDRRLFTASLLALAACDDDSDGIKEPPPPVTPPATDAAIKLTSITDAASLKALLDERRAATGAPGIAAYVFDAKGMLLGAASGERVAGRDSAVTLSDQWHLGSCTKAMTAALYARLVERGRAKWGATAQALLPDIAPNMEGTWRDTPVEMFLCHRAGVRDLGGPWLLARRGDKRPLTEQRTEAAATILTRPPVGKPGEFEYANFGYVIVGAMIERITGKTWEDAMREHVFEPLGMAGAGFGPPLGDAPQGHSGSKPPFMPLGAGVTADNPAALGPAGTVHAGFDDWAKFVRVFLDPAQTFLKPETVTHLLTPPAGGDYALGWGVIDSPIGGKVVTHTGSNTFWMANVVIQPEFGKASFVATNCGVEAAMRPVARSLMASVKAGTIL